MLRCIGLLRESGTSVQEVCDSLPLHARVRERG